MDTKRTDRKYLARDLDPEDLEVVRTEGCFVFDARGRRYIDFLAGWCVGNAGWGNRGIRSRIRRARIPDYVYPYHLYRPWAELAELLARVAPGKLQKTYRATGGTEAVDIALQIAMVYTGRRKFLSLEGSYHGNSIGAVSIGSTDGRAPYPNLLGGCLKVAPPLDRRAAERVERLLARRDVAAFILEPISMNLGVLVPEREFMTRVARSCRRHRTLLILDEVACGFGRTGRLFATEHFGIEPDILCTAKALSGGYAPIGATITTAKIARTVAEETSFYSTYGWHPLSVEAAIGNLRWMIRHRERLMRAVNATGDYFRRRLARMEFRKQVEVRVVGLAIGIATGDDDYASRVADRCRRKGLLLTSSGDVITMFPPLTLDRPTAKAGLDVFEGCLR